MHPIVQEDIQNIVRALGSDARCLEGSSVLITGGAGFIGSYITATIAALNRDCFSRPCQVFALDNYLTGTQGGLLGALEDPTISHVRHDVRHPLPDSFEPEYLIHAAGVASPVYYKRYPIETIEGTVLGIKHLLEHAHARDIKGMLYFSSSEIYGDPDPNFVPTPETYKGNVSSIGPRSCYDESKRLGETLCMAYHTMHGIPVKIVRPFNVYGPGMKLDDYRVIPTFMLYGLQGKPLPVHDQGNQTRTFCYVSDAVTGFFKVLLRGNAGEAYNVGHDAEEINMYSLAERVAELCDPRVHPQRVAYPDAYPTDEPRRRCPDLAKVKAHTGYAPAVDLRTGLSRTLAWFRDAQQVAA